MGRPDKVTSAIALVSWSPAAVVGRLQDQKAMVGGVLMGLHSVPPSCAVTVGVWGKGPVTAKQCLLPMPATLLAQQVAGSRWTKHLLLKACTLGDCLSYVYGCTVPAPPCFLKSCSQHHTFQQQNFIEHGSLSLCVYIVFLL